MKFVKSDLAKKLIVILVALLVFNVVFPSMTYAVDLLGILGQPLYWLLLGTYIPADLILGSIIKLDQVISFGTIESNTNSILEKDGTDLSDWFIGPDTIFKRRYCSI